MLTEKLLIFMRIYKQFDPSFSPICYYSFIFGLLQISISLSVFGFVANEYKWTPIWSHSTIRNIQSGIRWMNLKVKKTIRRYLELIIVPSLMVDLVTLLNLALVHTLNWAHVNSLNLPLLLKLLSSHLTDSYRLT